MNLYTQNEIYKIYKQPKGFRQVWAVLKLVRDILLGLY